MLRWQALLTSQQIHRAHSSTMIIPRLFSFTFAVFASVSLVAAVPVAKTDILVEHAADDAITSIPNNLDDEIDQLLVEIGSSPISL